MSHAKREVHIAMKAYVEKAEENGTWIAWVPDLVPFGPVGKGQTPEGAVWSLRLRLTQSYKR